VAPTGSESSSRWGTAGRLDSAMDTAPVLGFLRHTSAVSRTWRISQRATIAATIIVALQQFLERNWFPD